MRRPSASVTTSLGLRVSLIKSGIIVRPAVAIVNASPTYAAVIVTLAVVAALACLAPAHRAAAIDPMRALRAD
jgi:ABC-type lipoprotein release transport system permease subunit